MAEQTRISWADATFNPWMGCTKVSPGCKHCYAEKLTKNRMGIEVWGQNAPRQVTKTWHSPVVWNRKAEGAAHRPRVFCGSLCDVFEDHPTAHGVRPRLWALIRSTPNLDWLLLTKRAKNIVPNLPDDWGKGYRNVWLGVSVESYEQQWRAVELSGIRAVVRFVSYEPALGPLDDAFDLRRIDWLIAGGESGPGHRPDEDWWYESIMRDCRDGGVAFWMKQRSGPRPGEGGTVRGVQVQELPSPRRGVVAHGEQATLGFSKEQQNGQR